MLKAKLYLPNLLFLLFFNSKILHSQDTVVSGKAHNAKYGAIVVLSNNDVYYIDKLKSWGPDIYEKTIKVTGKLVVKEIKKKKTNTIMYGGITGPIKIIKKPKIEVIPDS